MEKYTINIANDFSPVLGGRYKHTGEYSGEQFYEDILKAKYDTATGEGERLFIYLDGTGSYASSFLDESFGRLARENGLGSVKANIVFKTNTFQWIVDYINKEIWQEN